MRKKTLLKTPENNLLVQYLLLFIGFHIMYYMCYSTFHFWFFADMFQKFLGLHFSYTVLADRVKVHIFRSNYPPNYHSTLTFLLISIFSSVSFFCALSLNDGLCFFCFFVVVCLALEAYIATVMCTFFFTSCPWYEWQYDLRNFKWSATIVSPV